MLTVTKTEPTEVRRIPCSTCGEKLPKVGLTKDSRVSGLTFRCGKCGTFNKVKTE